MDVGGEADHTHDLGDAGTGEALPAGDVGPVGGVAGFEQGLPLDGLPQEIDHPGRLGLARGRREGAHDPVGGDPARQGADVAVFECALRPEGDLDGILSIFPGSDVLF